MTSLQWLTDGQWIKGSVLLFVLLIGLVGLEIVGARIIFKLREEDEA
ncbi:MAG: hypothetical protein GY803_06300 [Chloroflexi bacterium]|nr:hypothetical protein [Chloroflexota bacterium]